MKILYGILFTKILSLFTFVHYAKRSFELFFISSKRTPSLFHRATFRFFFFFHSGRVAKTRNFVKYHYFEAPTSIKNIVYNGPKPVDSRCPLSAVILLFPRNFSFLFSPSSPFSPLVINSKTLTPWNMMSVTVS